MRVSLGQGEIPEVNKTMFTIKKKSGKVILINKNSKYTSLCIIRIWEYVITFLISVYIALIYTLYISLLRNLIT